MDVPETVVDYDIKVGRWSQLNEYVKLYEYQRSTTYIDFGLRHSYLIFSNFFYSITSRPIKAKFHVALPWNGRMEVSSMVQVTWRGWPLYLYMVKPLKIFFPGTKRLMNLKLGMQHLVLKSYQLCPNDDPGLTMTNFMTGTNLFPNASAWVSTYTA